MNKSTASRIFNKTLTITDTSKGFARMYCLPLKLQLSMFEVELRKGNDCIPTFDDKITSMFENMSDNEYYNWLRANG